MNKLMVFAGIFFSTAFCKSGLKQGNDVYYAYSTSLMLTHKSLVFKGTMKFYLSASGKQKKIVDSEDPFFGWVSDGKGGNIPEISHVYHKMETTIESINDTLHYLRLSDSAKTFKLEDYPPKMHDGPPDTSILQIVGKETMNGFNTTHARIITMEEYNEEKRKVETVDIWFSKQVPTAKPFGKAFGQLLSKFTFDEYPPEINAQLQKEGCTGVVVRLVSDTGPWIMTINLEKAEYISAADSLFAIPAGYKLQKKKSYD